MAGKKKSGNGQVFRVVHALLWVGLAMGLILVGGTASAGKNARLDMAGLLDQVLAEQTLPETLPLKSVSPMNRITFRTHTGNAGPLYLAVPVAAEPSKGELPDTAWIYHVIGPVWQTPAPYAVPYWLGLETAIAGPVTPDGCRGILDAGPFVPPASDSLTLPIHTLAGSSRAVQEDDGVVIWGDLAATPSDDALTVNVSVMDADWVDPDLNGLPRALFDTVHPDDCWVSVTRGTGGGLRTLMVRRIDSMPPDKADSGMLTLQPREDITVVVPGLSLLTGAGLVAEGDEVAAVVEVADSAADLIDSVTGTPYSDVADWAQAVQASQPGTFPQNAYFVQVVLVSRDRGPIEDLGSLFCTLVFSGMRFTEDSAGAGVSVMGVSTQLDLVEEDGNGLFTNHPERPLWLQGDPLPTVSRDSGVVLSRVHTSGAFIPVISDLRVTACVPPVLPPEIPVPVTLRGRFAVTGGTNLELGLTLQEADEQYEVFFTDENGAETSWIPASFREVATSAGLSSVTPPDGDGNNLMFITTPDLSPLLGAAALRPISVLIRSRGNPGDRYLFRGVQTRATATLETQISGEGYGTVSAVVNQPQYGLEHVTTLGDSAVLGLGTGVYWAGAEITATARPDDHSALTGWLVNGVNRGDGTVNPLTFTLGGGENILEVQFHSLVTTRYRLNLESVVGGVVTVTPAQPQTGYPAGTTVSLAAAPNPGNRFVRWMGDLTGVADPAQPLITVTMDADRTLNAIMIPETNRFLLVDQPSAGGTIAVDPPASASGYLPGVSVILTAVADTLYVFDRWTGDVDDPLANPTTLIMDADRQVGARFYPPVRLIVTAGSGGSVAAETVPVTGPAKSLDTLYPYGTKVRVTAIPAANYAFIAWTGPDAALLENPAQPVQEITLSQDVSLQAVFESDFDVDSIEPAEAWIFGGITATIRGRGLRDGMTALFDDVASPLYNAAPDGTSAVVVVPSLTDQAPDTLSVAVTVRVRDGEAETPRGVAFTYQRYRVSPVSGILATAFALPDTSVSRRVPLLVENGDLDTASLEIPPLNLNGPLCGVVLLRRIAAADAKADMTAPPGSLVGSILDAPGTQDTGVAGLYDFSIYFYQASDGALPAVGGWPTLQSADDAVRTALSRGMTPDGTPTAGIPMQITLPAGQSDLTYAIQRTGLRVYGVASQYDYLSDVESYDEPVTPRYESTVLDDELAPAPDQVSSADIRPDTVTARVYAPGGFRMFCGALLSDRAAGLVRIAKVNGLPGAAARGAKSGGTVLTFHATEGGLAYVDRVELVAADGRRVTASDTQFITRTGSDEYQLEFRVPRADFRGITDVCIYLKSDPGQPAVVLERAFEYTPGPLGALPFFFMLLALLSVVIGLAFGL